MSREKGLRDWLFSCFMEALTSCFCWIVSLSVGVSNIHQLSAVHQVKTVHICEATLQKKLIEFENTEARSLSIDEFTSKTKEYEKEMQSCKQSSKELKMPGLTEVVCQHKSNAVQSGFGLCKYCYLEFCGGLYGSEPPAFQRAEMERLANQSVDKNDKGSLIEAQCAWESTSLRCNDSYYKTGKAIVIYKYPADPKASLGYLSFGFPVASTLAGGLSLFYHYKGKSIPWSALFQSTRFFVFFLIAL
ncbi:hypothetical protein Lser_V15G40745 [Lactuca serriola]